MNMAMRLMRVLMFDVCIAVTPAGCNVGAGELENRLATTELQGQTEIEAVERSLGIILEKEIKVISDERQNSVTLLLASRKKEILDDFVSNTDISIEILPSFTPPLAPAPHSPAAESPPPDSSQKNAPCGARRRTSE